MACDTERIDRVRGALRDASLDALVCALPSNVLLLSGYWPVLGSTVAVVTAEGAVGLALPEDERELAEAGWADIGETFAPGSLEALPSLSDALAPALSRLLRRLGAERGRVGYEHGPALEPSSYAGTNRYAVALAALLSDLCPSAELVSADAILLRLRAVLTPRELARLRVACRAVGEAFRIGVASVTPGATEREVAAAFSAPLGTYAVPEDGELHLQGDNVRAGGVAHCMSGPNAALAFRAYARTRSRRIEPGDLVMVHCNSFVDGFWTDVTRTFHPGPPGRDAHPLFDAVLAARRAALETIRPGVRARDVDRSARAVLAAHGFGGACRHGIGHGVGFAAIDHHARPRIHPVSDDVLETGMVFNVEPAVYLEGRSGLRQCEMVAVTPAGAELLTPFQSDLEELTLIHRKPA